MQPELLEDTGHMAFDGGHGDHEFMGDARIRPALGDQPQHLPFPRRQPVERARLAVPSHQPRDHIRVEDRPAVSDTAYRVGEHPQVTDLLLQQVAHA